MSTVFTVMQAQCKSSDFNASESDMCLHLQLDILYFLFEILFNQSPALNSSTPYCVNRHDPFMICESWSDKCIAT